jgi:L-ascorbate metabolism protein UlaG (beta-lactamase superfamily)
MLPIGDNFTMGIDDAVRACELIRAKLFLPMHYNTFPVIKADGEEFLQKVKAKGLRAREIKVGGTLEL